jgi:hypothetical protein
MRHNSHERSQWRGARWENWAGDRLPPPERVEAPRSREALQSIIKQAEASQPPRHVRAAGSLWSFTDLAYTPHLLIDTRQLAATLGDVFPDPTRQGRAHPQKDAIYHVEAGVTIRDLYLRLDKSPTGNRYALPTMGGASGQTLAGALSTGTHGGDLHLPPMSDMVVAIHLVGTDGAESWIQAEDLDCSAELIQRTYPGTAYHRDDELLKAALVSLGRFGVLYAVVLRVTPQFALEEVRSRDTWNNVRPRLPELTRTPDQHFLQVVIVPFSGRAGEPLRCFVTSRKKLPMPESHRSGAGVVPLAPEIAEPFAPTLRSRLVDSLISALDATLFRSRRFTPGTILAAFSNLATKYNASWLTRGLTTWVLSRAPQLAATPQPVVGVSYELMDLSSPIDHWYRAISAEYFVSAVDVRAAGQFVQHAIIDVIDAAMDEGIVPAGYVSVRFTGRSRGLLAMERWDLTCAVEVAILRGIRGSPELLERIQARTLDAGGTVHWGQYNTLDSQGVERMYGSDLNRWRRALGLVAPADRPTFANAYTERCGLEPGI